MLAVAALTPGVPAAAGPGQAPPAPTGLVIRGYGGTAELSWRQPPGPRATSFRVYEHGAVVARNTTTSVQLTNLGFANGHTYTVTAVDAAGRESAPSAPVSRTLGISGVPPLCAPSALSGLAVSEVTPTAATLTWVGDDEPGFTTVTGAPGGPVSTEESGVRIGGLAPATTYRLAVERQPYCNAPGSPAVEVTVTTPAGSAGTPAPPVNPVASGRTDTTVTLSWESPVGGPVARYAVYESGRRVATTIGTSATVRGLYHAAAYSFQVAALDARGGESPAAAVRATTATCQARPPRPAAVTATALSASSVRLDWVYDAAAQSYTVYAGDVPLGTSAGTAVVVGGLASATAYRLRVAATLPNGCGAGPASADVRVTTPAGPLGRPARPGQPAVTAADPVTGLVTLGWLTPDDGDPATGYRVYRGADVVATVDANQATLALPKATTQVLTVAAVNAAGLESAHSTPVTVQVPYLPPP
jgi:chitodextrinase